MQSTKAFDDVNGQIVGGDYGMCWVTYEGRKQGQTMYACDYPEADALCFATVERIRQDCGEAFDLIYPDKNAWKFHFDGI